VAFNIFILKVDKRILAALILSLLFGANIVYESNSQSQYSLEIKGRTWDHSSITILILQPVNAPWWNPVFLNAATHAVGEWNDAMSDFASKQSPYEFLSGVELISSVSNVTASNFDVYVSWAESLPTSGGVDVLGTTETYSQSSGIIVNCTISMSSKDQLGLGISEADMQNGVLHEIGHVLGLGHTSVSGDIMSPAVILGGGIRAVSSLDEFGVATVFNWLPTSSQFSLGNWRSESSVTLPSTISYSYSPISNENLPPQSTLSRFVSFFESLIKYFANAISGIGFGLFLIFVGLILVVLILAIKSRQKPSSDDQLGLKVPHDNNEIC